MHPTAGGGDGGARPRPTHLRCLPGPVQGAGVDSVQTDSRGHLAKVSRGGQQLPEPERLPVLPVSTRAGCRPAWSPPCGGRVCGQISAQRGPATQPDGQGREEAGGDIGTTRKAGARLLWMVNEFCSRSHRLSIKWCWWGSEAPCPPTHETQPGPRPGRHI